MDWFQLAKNLEGLQTIVAIAKILNISEKTAINYVYELRKRGYIETEYGKRKIRMYRVRIIRKKLLGYPGLHEMINKYSKVKLVPAVESRIHTHKLSVEETIVRGLKTKRIRVILAILGLFNHITNWPLLASMSKQENIGREIGALYDVARTFMRVRRMDKRTRESLLKSKIESKYIIENMKSKDFRDIEKKWNVFIPISKKDLEIYKE